MPTRKIRDYSTDPAFEKMRCLDPEHLDGIIKKDVPISV
jgi:hypothetical protein